MYRRFQNRFGTAGVIVAVVALIAALSGTALAASGALTGKQKKEVEKIAKKYAGKDGAPGAAGTNGTNGKDGTNGSPGSPGAAGTSATVASFTGSKGTCTKGQGGLEVKSASATTYVCNGEEGEEGLEGPEGPEGSPWTAGGTLPPGATEKGTWGVAWGPQGGGGILAAPISFPIPLFEEIKGSHVHIAIPFGDPNCTGGSKTPTAKPGELCLYETTASGVLEESVLPEILLSNFVTPGADKQGAVLSFEAADESGYWFGGYAVTGCSKAVGAQFPCP